LTPEHVSTSMVGLHAARLSSPWVAMRARAAHFEPGQLRRPLIEERSLLKLRCMRRTLHILPPALAATAHAATLSQRLPPCDLALRRLGQGERALRSTAEAIRSRLSGETIDYRALTNAVAHGRRDPRFVRLAIKWLWERGELVYLDLSPSLHHEHRAFALTSEAFPGLSLATSSCAASQEELVLAHIRAFGPVSVRDIAWWSGLGLNKVRAIVARRRHELVPVVLSGAEPELLLRADDLDELEGTEPIDPEHITLLSYEDPSLKGYFETRSRYVPAASYDKLFNSIGEARASVLRGGRVVGVWTWNRKARRIESVTLERLTPTARRRIADQLHDMESFLRAEAIER
jgi:hypothetical protein